MSQEPVDSLSFIFSCYTLMPIQIIHVRETLRAPSRLRVLGSEPRLSTWHVARLVRGTIELDGNSCSLLCIDARTKGMIIPTRKQRDLDVHLGALQAAKQGIIACAARDELSGSGSRSPRRNKQRSGSVIRIAGRQRMAQQVVLFHARRVQSAQLRTASLSSAIGLFAIPAKEQPRR
jgi:hypothetical protein